MNRNLEQFFLRPHEDIVATQCRYIASEHPGIGYGELGEPSYDWEKVKQLLIPDLGAYFSGLKGPIGPEEAERMLHLAKEDVAAAQACRYRNTDKSPRAFANSVRRSMLMHHPDFLADKTALPFVKLYSKIDPPVSFQAWVTYQTEDSYAWVDEEHTRSRFQPKDHYYLRDGFGVHHIPSLHNFILADELWTGHSEWRRVFFASVGELLQYLSKEQGLLLETIEPRMELMRRVKRFNTDTHPPHEPLCASAFMPSEVDTLHLIAKHYDPKIKCVLKTMQKEGMLQTHHYC